MSESIKSFYKEFEQTMAKAQELNPNAVAGFGGLFQKTMSAGALTVREKELIALGIGLACRCEPCILMHVKKSIEAGATKAEILEAAGVAVMMQGGPGFVHLPMIIKALEANGL